MTRLRVLSYNVRYANEADHHDVWPSRRDGVASLVRFHRPAIVGFQEPLPEQRRDLRERLPTYEFVGRGRRADGEGEGCPIAVRRDRLTIRDSGTFWLSETPDEPSVGWDASYPRIATWARVAPRDEDGNGKGDGDEGDAWLVVNVHFDHVGTRARRESARLLRERAADLADGDPVVVCGDLNATPDSEPHRELTDGDLQDAATTADLRHGPQTSLTDFETLIDGRRIDHVLVSPRVDVDAFATLADRDDRGRYPSDHLPVLAKLRV
ncbi:endonuclease/exonuclease/phosphatase family protein [Halorubrum gandharaense]